MDDFRFGVGWQGTIGLSVEILAHRTHGFTAEQIYNALRNDVPPRKLPDVLEVLPDFYFFGAEAYNIFIELGGDRLWAEKILVIEI